MIFAQISVTYICIYLQSFMTQTLYHKRLPKRETETCFLTSSWPILYVPLLDLHVLEPSRQDQTTPLGSPSAKWRATDYETCQHINELHLVPPTRTNCLMCPPNHEVFHGIMPLAVTHTKLTAPDCSTLLIVSKQQVHWSMSASTYICSLYPYVGQWLCA